MNRNAKSTVFVGGFIGCCDYVIVHEIVGCFQCIASKLTLQEGLCRGCCCGRSCERHIEKELVNVLLFKDTRWDMHCFAL